MRLRFFALLIASGLVPFGLFSPPARAAAPCAAAGNGAVIANWFGQLNAAWERGDALAAASLFDRDATYREDPFQRPMRGKQAIFAYWTRIIHSQRNVRTTFHLLSACGNTGIVHWTASFVRVPSGQKVRLDGIAEVTLDGHGRGLRFLEWWNIDRP